MTSLYDEIGGSAVLAAAVDDLCMRILGDAVLSPYFARVDMIRQTRHMRAFLAAALGGPDVYAGRDMALAHARLRVSGEAFDRFAGHLVGTLKGLGVRREHIDAILARMAPLRAQIVAEERQVALRI
jgi:hemoglobin